MIASTFRGHQIAHQFTLTRLRQHRQFSALNTALLDKTLLLSQRFPHLPIAGRMRGAQA